MTLDVASILAQRLAPIDMLRAVHWVAQYFWFLPCDPSSASLPPCSSILQFFSQLHLSSKTPIEQDVVLSGKAVQRLDSPPDPGAGFPSRCQFSTLQICMRSVLEALAERLGGLPEVNNQQHEGADWREADSRAQVHERLLQLCCPLLDQARIALQARRCLSPPLFRTLSHWQPQKVSYSAFRISTACFYDSALPLGLEKLEVPGDWTHRRTARNPYKKANAAERALQIRKKDYPLPPLPRPQHHPLPPPLSTKTQFPFDILLTGTCSW